MRAIRSVSVALNLEDDRDFWHEAVTSWRKDQDFDGQVELVVASNGESPEVDGHVRRLLRPEDQFVSLLGASRIQLYDAAVRAARGDIVVITEAHCAAEAGCLGQLVAAFEDEAAHAVLGRTVPFADSPFGALDAEIFERGKELCGFDGDWRNVVPHCFAIRRTTYHELGGFETRYDLFAQQLLASSLHRANRPIVLVPGACVRHRFAEHTAQVVRVVEGSGRGQAVLYADRELDELELDLMPAGFLDPAETDGRLARRAVLGALAGRSRLRDVSHWVPQAVMPLRARISVDSFLLRIAALRCTLWRRGGHRLERAYLDLATIATRRGRRRGMAEAGPPKLANVEARWSDAHDPEVWSATEFRWTKPTTALVTNLRRDDWTLVLHTPGFGRDPRDANVRVVLDGRKVPPGAVMVSEREVRVAVPTRRLRTGRPQCWVIACDPLVHPNGSRDDRSLGLPITGVEWLARTTS